MKRDMDLVRKLLLLLEEGKHGSALEKELEPDGYTAEQVMHHAALLSQAGLINAVNISYKGTVLPMALAESLTWNGHEFLDAARDEARWTQAKAALTKLGGFSLPLMQQLLVSYMKKQLGLE